MATTFAEIELNNLHCYTQNDQNNPNNPAEPYLWVTFFKIDGYTTTVGERSAFTGYVHVFPKAGNHADLGERQVRAGDDVRIPSSLGRLNTAIKSIPTMNPVADDTDQPAGLFGCVAVLMEEDSSLNGQAAFVHNAMNDKFIETINKLLPTLNITHPRPSEAEIDALAQLVRAEISKAFRSLPEIAYFNVDRDDDLGLTVLLFSQDELTTQGTIRVQLRMMGLKEDWEITGLAKGQPAIDLIVPAYVEALGRYPRDDEINHWIDSMGSQVLTPTGVYCTILRLLVDGVLRNNDDERRSMIDRAYSEGFGRQPIDRERDVLFNQIKDSPITFRVLIKRLIEWLRSPDGATEIERVVDRAFWSEREQSPSPDELNLWVARVKSERLSFRDIANRL